MRLTIRGSQTFIALRARRQAHQIAREIINPPLNIEQVPEARRVIDFDPKRDLGPLVPIPVPAAHRWFFLVLFALCAAFALMLLIDLLQHRFHG